MVLEEEEAAMQWWWWQWWRWQWWCWQWWGTGRRVGHEPHVSDDLARLAEPGLELGRGGLLRQVLDEDLVALHVARGVLGGCNHAGLALGGRPVVGGGGKRSSRQIYYAREGLSHVFTSHITAYAFSHVT